MLQQLTQPLQGLGQGRGGQKPVAHLLEGLLTEGREKVLPAAGGFLGSRQSPGAGYRLVQGQLFPPQGQCVEIVGALGAVHQQQGNAVPGYLRVEVLGRVPVYAQGQVRRAVGAGIGTPVA